MNDTFKDPYIFDFSGTEGLLLVKGKNRTVVEYSLAVFVDYCSSSLTSIMTHRVFDYLSEIHEQKSVILNTNLEFSQWVNVLYDERMTTALIGRLTHHVDLVLFPGGNNRLRESSINAAWGRIHTQEVSDNGRR